MKLKVLATLSLIALSGCAGSGLGRAMEYKPEVTRVAMPDRNYRALDHKTENFVMITPTVGNSAVSGLVFGATLPSLTQFEAAARQYLDDTDRKHCDIVSRGLVATPQYEFGYKC